MEHEASSFLGCAEINWDRIARARFFYMQKGYKYLEVPWAVSSDLARATMPWNANPIRIENSNLVLVGSAEQGFLALLPSLTSDAPYFSISPCFRGETELQTGHTQLTFMKVELFFLRKSAPVLMRNACEFMSDEGADLSTVPTPEGKDLTCAGIEVGSYGVRTWKDSTWVYGTGLAEPRFSTALRWQKEQHGRHHGHG